MIYLQEKMLSKGTEESLNLLTTTRFSNKTFGQRSFGILGLWRPKVILNKRSIGAQIHLWLKVVVWVQGYFWSKVIWGQKSLGMQCHFRSQVSNGSRSLIKIPFMNIENPTSLKVINILT